MVFEDERELVNAYLEKCKKQGYCEITNLDFPSKNLIREFHIPGYGRVDLIFFNFGANPNDGFFYGQVYIYEFKNGNLCRDDVVQINRYYQGIKLLIESGDVINSIDHIYSNIGIRLHLIGAAQNFNLDTILLINSIPDLNIWTHKIVNGEIELTNEELGYIEPSLDNNSKFHRDLFSAKAEWKKYCEAGWR